jgi:hypothetical protein
MSALIMANGRATTRETKLQLVSSNQKKKNNKELFLIFKTTKEIDCKIEVWSMLS